METYEKLEKKLDETKMYAKRVMDLYCDAKKWHYLANESSTPEDNDKYTRIANTLMELFYKEIQSMKL